MRTADDDACLPPTASVIVRQVNTCTPSRASLAAVFTTSVVLILVSTPVHGQAPESGADSAPHQAGAVEFVCGDSMITPQVGDSRLVVKDSQVNEGDTVITFKGGEAQLHMLDGAYLMVRENSRLKIEAYVADGGDKDRSILDLIKGTVRSITGWVGKYNRAAYEIRTPILVTIGVCGTDHEVTYIPPGDPRGEPGVYDKVNEGKAFMRSGTDVVEVPPQRAGRRLRRTRRTAWRATGRAPAQGARAALTGRLQQAALRERERLVAGDDEVIEYFDLNERERFGQAAREQLVGLARLRHARGMVVGEDHGGRISAQGGFDDFTRVDAGLGQRAAEQFLGRDHTVLRVEEQRDEYLVLAGADREAQVVAHGGGRVERRAGAKLLAQAAARHLQYRRELGRLCLAQALDLAQRSVSCGEQTRHSAEAADKLPRQLDRALARNAAAQEDGHQFGVREARRPERQKSLARTLSRGPIRDRHAPPLEFT